MKRIECLLFALLLVPCLLHNLMPTASASSTGTQHGVEVTITTDRDEYAVNEDICVSVVIKNNNTHSIENLSIEMALPNGVEIQKGNIFETNIDVSAGEIYTVPYVMRTNILQNDQHEQVDLPQSSEDSNIVVWVILAAVLSGAMIIATILMVIFKKKAKVMGLLLCVAIGITMLPMSALAADQNDGSIMVEKTIKVNKANLVIKTFVKHNVNTDAHRAEAEEFYTENSEQIVSIDVVDGDATLSEKEVCLLLKERGFTQYSITYDYNLSGEYIGEGIASTNNDTRHPMYQTGYVSSKGEVWIIFVIGKEIYANPAFYNLNASAESQMLVAEDTTLTSYDHASGHFFNTIPKGTAVEVVTLERINKESLEKIAFKEAAK